MTDKEGEADRKVPLQPLVFIGKDGKVSRYNLRKVSKKVTLLIVTEISYFSTVWRVAVSFGPGPSIGRLVPERVISLSMAPCQIVIVPSSSGPL